jgi:hypothetical protein
MKTSILKKSFTLIGLFVTLVTNVYGQAFPTFFDVSHYDTEQGTKGRLFVINKDVVLPNVEIKPVIFATNTSSGLKDLFRITTNGVATLNSPFDGYGTKLDFYAQNLWQGYVLGESNHLEVAGKEMIRLGVSSNYTAMEISANTTKTTTNLHQAVSGVLMRYGISDDKRQGWIGSESAHDVVLGTNLKSCIYMDTNQKVYMGLTPSEVNQISLHNKETYGLFVKKGVLAEDVAIGPQSSWADFVFKPDYGLKPIHELKQFIQVNKHLPDVPSESAVKENGYSQHEMNKILLQKIEELTLYIIQQDEKIKQQNARIEELESFK